MGKARLSILTNLPNGRKHGGSLALGVETTFPMDFVGLAKSIVKLGEKKGLPIVVEYVDKSGRSKTMALPI
jgi:hypothetical protein